MASIERTVSPRLKSNFTKAELRDFYTPSLEEIFFVRETARNDEPQLRLGYFPQLEDVPESIIVHLQSALNFSKDIIPVVIPRTLYRHQNAVRGFLKVKSYNKEAHRLIIKTVYEAAQVMDNPGDLINAAIEELIKERFELPAFSTLDRLVRRIRSLVNRRLWNTILRRLSSADLIRLDSVFLPDPKAFRKQYNALKQLPKKPTLKHLQELLGHLEWLLGLGDFDSVLENIPPLKIKHFGGEAKVLDAALVDLLDNYHLFRLPKFWGDGTHASADSTKYDLSEQNLMAEYHIRYGGYGGIAYYHVSDLYIALFSHFISCGTWEAVYIIDGLLKNKSEIQPDTLHADTQPFSVCHTFSASSSSRESVISRTWFSIARTKRKNTNILTCCSRKELIGI